jgi:hypothetical protein
MKLGDRLPKGTRNQILGMKAINLRPALAIIAVRI